MAKQWREDQEALSREAWERMRIQTTSLVNIHTTKGKNIKPKQLMTFPWDHDKTSNKPLTREERENTFGDWDNYMKKKWQASQT